MKTFSTQPVKLLRKAVATILIGALSLSVHAEPAGASGTLDPNNPCNTANWQITGAIPSSSYTGTVPDLSSPIASTSCAGVYSGNEGPALNPSPNLGYLNDGLLNGQYGLLSPTQFISPSQLQALQTPGQFVDPGWIMLGQLGGNAGELNYSTVSPVGGTTFSLSSVLKYTQEQTSDVGGTWLLEISKDIVAILNGYNFPSRSSFDHLAFSVKSSTSWAVYDFDFNLINANTGGAFDLSIPYTLKGIWTMNGDFENDRGNDQDISHITVWARDPLSTRQVPAPGTLLLLGLGLIAMSFSRKYFSAA